MSDLEYAIEKDGVLVTVWATAHEGIVKVTTEALDHLMSSAGWTRIEPQQASDDV